MPKQDEVFSLAVLWQLIAGRGASGTSRHGPSPWPGDEHAARRLRGRVKMQRLGHAYGPSIRDEISAGKRDDGPVGCTASRDTRRKWARALARRLNSPLWPDKRRAHRQGS